MPYVRNAPHWKPVFGLLNGGLDMAVQQTMGGTLAWVSDIEPGPCKILAHRHPGVPNLGDVTAVDWATVEPVDVICGGSPCQDVSTAGRRAGMRPGTRSGLWESMREAIAIIRPTWVVWENVRGALSAEAHSDMVDDPGLLGDRRGEPVLRALGRVLGDLADLGYDAEWRGLRASDVGAPHQRFRVFVLARRRDASDTTGDARRIGHRDLLTPADADDAGLEGRRQVRERAGQQPAGAGRLGPVTLLPTPRTSDTNGSGQHGTGGPDLRTAITLLPTPTACSYGSNQSDSPGAAIRPSLDGVAKLLPTPRASDGPTPSSHARSWSSTDNNLHTVAKQDRWGDYAAAIARWEAIVGQAPPPTEPGRNGPRLSPTFTEWLMGLPAGWITDVPGITRTEALRACGNGVVPQQASAALVDMLSAYQDEEVAA